MSCSLWIDTKWLISAAEVARRWRSAPAWRGSAGPVRVTTPIPVAVAVTIPIPITIPVALVPVSFAVSIPLATSVVSVGGLSSVPKVEIAFSSSFAAGISGPASTAATSPSSSSPHKIPPESATSRTAWDVHQRLRASRWLSWEGVPVRVTSGGAEGRLVRA